MLGSSTFSTWDTRFHGSHPSISPENVLDLVSKSMRYVEYAL